MMTSTILRGSHRPIDRTAADFLGQAGGALIVAIGDRHVGPSPRQAERDRPRDAPRAQDQRVLVEQRAGGFFAVTSPPPMAASSESIAAR